MVVNIIYASSSMYNIFFHTYSISQKAIEGNVFSNMLSVLFLYFSDNILRTGMIIKQGEISPFHKCADTHINHKNNRSDTHLVKLSSRQLNNRGFPLVMLNCNTKPAFFQPGFFTFTKPNI